jgi:hypothetical protein
MRCLRLCQYGAAFGRPKVSRPGRDIGRRLGTKQPSEREYPTVPQLTSSGSPPSIDAKREDHFPQADSSGVSQLCDCEGREPKHRLAHKDTPGSRIVRD